MKKRCNYCHKTYPETYFGIALTTTTKTFRRRKCRYCYRDTKQILIQRYQNWLNNHKSRAGCAKCGIQDPRVLDFHHTDRTNKEFSIGTFRRAVGFKRIQTEVEKCEILCANCHRILHDEESRGKSVQKHILKLQ